MNAEEYIASGILESYLLGELSPEEQVMVEKMAQEHPAVKQELNAIEETLEAIAHKAAMTPPTAIKDKIFTRIRADKDSLEDQDTVVRPISGSGRGISHYLVAASISLTLVSSITAVVYWNKWKAAENQLSELVAQNQQMAENFNTASEKLEKTSQQLAIITDKDYQKVILDPLKSDNSGASVYWNPDNQEVYLSIASLPAPPSDKQYQLWALVDGQPIDAGVFDLPAGQSILLKMKSMSAADAFAITLEPKGGSVSPTLEELRVLGNV